MDECGYRIGIPGHMIRLDGSHGGLSRKWGTRTVVHDEGLGPAWAVTSLRRPRRTWTFAVEHAMAQEIAGLHEMAVSTSSPLMMVDPWAQVTNALTPEGSLWAGSNLPRVGGMDLLDGGHATHVVYNEAATSSTTGWVAAGGGPILPRATVTASTWIASAYQARCRLSWHRADGTAIDLTDGQSVTGTGSMRRATITATAPAGAVAAQVAAVGAQYLSRAALTWTSVPTDWGIGGLAAECVITDIDDDVQIAVPGADEGLRRTHVSVTVEEIGV